MTGVGVAGTIVVGVACVPPTWFTGVFVGGTELMPVVGVEVGGVKLLVGSVGVVVGVRVGVAVLVEVAVLVGVKSSVGSVGVLVGVLVEVPVDVGVLVDV